MSRKLRVLALMDEELVPPETLEGVSDAEMQEWKSEFDVCTTLRELGHELKPLGASADLGVIREALLHFKPHITFNLMEEFLGVAVYDQHIVSYLELMKQPYTGCNPRGLMLSHDKALCKKILAYHRIPTPRFLVAQRGRKFRLPKRLEFPLIVKSVSEEASLGITKNSIARDSDSVFEQVAYIHDQIGTDALVEEFIEGRELYVGVMGNRRLQTLPIWELSFRKLPDDTPNIATARVKWDYDYQKEVGVITREARDLPPGVDAKISRLCKRIYRILHLSGYARMDLRLHEHRGLFVLEANPNPNLSYGEDFAESASTMGVSYEKLIQRILNLGLAYQAEWSRA